MAETKNRWLIAAAAVGSHISIGSVYAWSQPAHCARLVPNTFAAKVRPAPADDWAFGLGH